MFRDTRRRKHHEHALNAFQPCLTKGARPESISGSGICSDEHTNGSDKCTETPVIAAFVSAPEWKDKLQGESKTLTELNQLQGPFTVTDPQSDFARR
jgi:hypothetical protein